MTKPKVYVETTIVSYLTAIPSRDLVRSAHQKVTRDWWRRRDRFDLYASEAVLQEAAGGNAAAAARRLAALDSCLLVTIDERAAALSRALLAAHALPAKAKVDALHVAVAAIEGMDYLLTWNCKHIANAATRGIIEEVCRKAGYEPPTICTPEELSEQWP